MNKKALAVIVVFCLVIIAGAVGYYIYFNSNLPQPAAKPEITNNLEGHSLVLKSDYRTPRPILDELKAVGIHTYDIKTSIVPLTIKEGAFATTQTLGIDKENLSGVDVSVDKDKQQINLTIYLNVDAMKQQEQILFHVNQNYLKGLLFAKIQVEGESESSEPREQVSYIVQDILNESGEDYFIHYE